MICKPRLRGQRGVQGLETKISALESNISAPALSLSYAARLRLKICDLAIDLRDASANNSMVESVALRPAVVGLYHSYWEDAYRRICPALQAGASCGEEPRPLHKAEVLVSRPTGAKASVPIGQLRETKTAKLLAI